VDGEAEERVELNSASLVISVSPLMVGRGVETCRTQMLRKAHARDAPVVQQILFASNMVLSESGTGQKKYYEEKLSRSPV
jgi:hypothetical protein